MIKLELNPSHFDEILKKGYSLDIVYTLMLIQEGYEYNKENVKISTLLQAINRKGLVSDTNELTLEGKALLAFLSTTGEKFVKRKPVEDHFSEWWKTYPGTDNFTHKGKTFVGSRTLRAAKEECRIKFNKILLEGEYTYIDMIEALKYDVLSKKEASIKEATNKLKYMQNSLTYLNQRSFEPYIELVKAGLKIKESTTVGTTDI